MKTLKILLGSVALILASSATVKADLLIAGPIPANIRNGTIVCSAFNLNPDGTGPETVEVILQDANNQVLNSSDNTCLLNNGILVGGHSCSLTVILRNGTDPNGVAVASPFVCDIASASTNGGQNRIPIRGSICETNNNEGKSTACLQALLNNETSP